MICNSVQEVREELFEAGYSIDAIDDVLADNVKAGVGKGPSSTACIEPGVCSSGSVTENAFDVLKGIRVQNVNKIIIGTLNIISLASKFD